MARAKKPKPKSKVKRKKTAAKKPVRKVLRKVVTAAKKVFKKPTPKKTPKPESPPAEAPPPGERLGVVTHYFGHLSVAVVKLDLGATLRVGDNIHVKGHTSDFSQRVESLQVGHAPVQEVGADDDFGLKVIEHAREHDIVYRVK